MSSKIEWTDETWNPVTGCDKVSAGCDNCYAERIATRFGRPFLGAVEQHPERLEAPLHWRKPRRVFVNSVSDLFHPEVDDLFLSEVFAVMSLTPQHTYQILTKRPKAMLGVLTSDDWWYKVSLVRTRRRMAAGRIEESVTAPIVRPLPNVWLGVSVENQRYADIRIPPLIETPAAVRFLSVEPMLGPVSLKAWFGYNSPGDGEYCPRAPEDQKLGWVIVGGESGRGARPMHPAWAREVRDDCVDAGVPYFLKQRGEWTWDWTDAASYREPRAWVCTDGRWTRSEDEAVADGGSWQGVWPVGKKKAGRLLDGETWDQYPA